MKRLNFVLIMLWGMMSSVTFAQRERNYIYLFDCTQSMNGYNNHPDIWEQTKSWLWDDIGQLKDGQVSVIPFQGKVYAPIMFDRADYNKGNIEKTLNDYIKDVTNTNICAAWDAGIKELDQHKDNYLYVLTDGLDNVSKMPALCKRIREWCGQNKNSYVFYVMLTKFAKDQALIDAINSCNTVFLIDGDGKHLPPFGAFAGNEITVNTQDYRPQSLGFSAAGTFKASMECADDLFEVSVGEISNGCATFTVKPKLDKAALATALKGQETHSFEAKVKGEGLMILNDIIRVKVINKPERTLSMAHEELDLGRASHYGKFLFKDASQPDTLTCSLQTVLNEEARKYHSSVVLQLTSESLKSEDYTLMMNGQELHDKTIAINETSGSTTIQLIIHPDAPYGKHYFTLKPIKVDELDRINEVEAKQYELSLRAVYSHSYNPLMVACCIILIILLALLILWFAAIRPVRYVSFKAVRLMVTGEPSLYLNFRIKGTREVRFTRSGKRQQNAFNKLFTGEIVFKQNPFEGGPDWSIKPRNSRGTKGGTIIARDYDIEPSNILTTLDDEPAVMSREGMKIEIKLM